MFSGRGLRFANLNARSEMWRWRPFVLTAGVPLVPQSCTHMSAHAHTRTPCFYNCCALISAESLKRQLLSIYTSTLGAPLLSAIGFYQASGSALVLGNATSEAASTTTTTTMTTTTTKTTTTTTETMFHLSMEGWSELAESLASNVSRMVQHLPTPVHRGRHWQALRLHKLILASQPQFATNTSSPTSASTTVTSSTSSTASTAMSSPPVASPEELGKMPIAKNRREYLRDLPIRVGQLVRHKSKGYRAVVVGHTPVCAASPGWINHHHIDALPRG